MKVQRLKLLRLANQQICHAITGAWAAPSLAQKLTYCRLAKINCCRVRCTEKRVCSMVLTITPSIQTYHKTYFARVRPKRQPPNMLDLGMQLRYLWYAVTGNRNTVPQSLTQSLSRGVTLKQYGMTNPYLPHVCKLLQPRVLDWLRTLNLVHHECIRLVQTVKQSLCEVVPREVPSSHLECEANHCPKAAQLKSECLRLGLWSTISCDLSWVIIKSEVDVHWFPWKREVEEDLTWQLFATRVDSRDWSVIVSASNKKPSLPHFSAQHLLHPKCCRFWHLF